MKKLQHLLGLFTIIASTATNIVACEKNTKNDLKNLTNTFTITSFKTAEDFKKKLIIRIKKESGFNNISDDEIEIFKKDGTVLDDAYITGTIIEVKVKSKDNAKKIFGEKDIKVTWSVEELPKNDLKNLTNTFTIASFKTAEDFKKKLIIRIKKESGFNNISDDEIEIFKKDGTVLNNAYITGTIIEVKVKSKDNAKKIFGEKDIKVTWSVEELPNNDLSILTAPTDIIPVGNNIEEFKTTLITAIKNANSNNIFATLVNSDFDIIDKPDFSERILDLSHWEVIEASKTKGKIEVGIIASTKGSKYVGRKKIDVNLQADLQYFKTPIGIIPPNNDINEFKTALISAIKKTNAGNVFAELESNDIELKNSADNVTLTHGDLTDTLKTTGKNINITIIASPTSAKYIGSKAFDVKLQANLNSLIEPNFYISLGNNISEFKDKLIIELRRKNPNDVFAELESNDIELKNSAGDADLTYDDVIAVSKTPKKLKVTIIASPTSAKYIGSKALDVDIQVEIKDLKVPTEAIPVGNDIYEFRRKLFDTIIKTNAGNVFTRLKEDKLFEYYNSAGDAELTYDDVISAYKTTEKKIIVTIVMSDVTSEFVANRKYALKFVGKKQLELTLS